MNTLGIDIGGSAVKGAPVNTRTGRLLAPPHRIATPTVLPPADLARVVADLAAHFAWTGPIGVGFPGVVTHGTIRFLGNLHPDFVGCPIVKLLAQTLRRRQADIAVINDADAAGLAEVRFGAGRKRKGTILMLTFGTGVGSGLFLNGHLYPNTEFGHLRFHGQSAERLISAAAKDRRHLDFPAWAAEVDAYLHQLEAVLFPDLIIVGGGISADHAKWFPHLTLSTPITPAKFFNEAGIVGAAIAGEA